jgi:hypothetical protein
MSPYSTDRDGAEQSTGADALQLTLRFSFRARLSASVRLQKYHRLPKKICQTRSTILLIGSFPHLKAHSRKEKAMTVYERTVAKMQHLPEPLLQEVSDFIDFLLVKQDQTQWELWTHFREALDIAEADFSDYLRNLETYEEGLARGDIRW